jgi:nucleotide-binding universal stress UspA family protein
MNNVLACIDGSPQAAAVCDCAAWASLQLDAPLTLLHVLDQQQYPAAGNLSGIIGLGSREYLLEELAALDEKRSKLALEEGRMMLDSAKQRVLTAGVRGAGQLRQRHGDLVESLRELEADTRLLVIGKQGEDSGTDLQLIGSQSGKRDSYSAPADPGHPGELQVPRKASCSRLMAALRPARGVEMLASSPLFKGIPIHLVMVGAESSDAWEQLKAAERVVQGSASEVHLAIRAGEVEPTLHAYQLEQGIDLLAMGAYGHSRIRQFLVGSTTSTLLRTSNTALLILR